MREDSTEKSSRGRIYSSRLLLEWLVCPTQGRYSDNKTLQPNLLHFFFFLRAGRQRHVKVLEIDSCYDKCDLMPSFREMFAEWLLRSDWFLWVSFLENAFVMVKSLHESSPTVLPRFILGFNCHAGRIKWGKRDHSNACRKSQQVEWSEKRSFSTGALAWSRGSV